MPETKTYLPLVNIEKVLSILNKISIFGGLTDSQLYTIFRLLKNVQYEKDEIIFTQGDDPTHIYIIISGEVRLIEDIDIEPLEIADFSKGDCFGETAVIGIQPHTATALAVEDTEVIVLTGEDLLSIYHKDKELFGMLILNIAREACRRLHKTTETLHHYVRSKIK